MRRGVVYSDGVAELLPLGVFPIQTAGTPLRTLLTAVNAFDRAQLVIDARLEDDYAVAAGTNYGTAIADLVRAGVPGLTVLLPPTSFVTPQLIVPMSSDRWATATEWAAACGWQLRFDGLGQLVGRTEPALSAAAPVWEISEGANLSDAAMTLDRQTAYNKWVVSGENTSTGAVYKGSAVDDTPGSPTFYGAGFGRKPMFYSSPLFTSDEQCATAAAAMKARSLGVARAIEFSIPPNPALEDGDAVTFTAARFGQTARLHLLDTLRLGLTARTGSSATTRSAA